MKIIKMRISQLNPAIYNPRVKLQSGDPEYEKLKKSLQEFGCVDPIIYNERTGNVVGGHQRLKVMRDLGIEETDVSVVDLPLEKEKALNLALNKISGQWDMPKLKDLLEELNTGEFDIEVTGFDAEEIEDIITQFEPLTEVKEDNFDIEKALEEIKEPVTKPGDIWQLGQHRLMCGDSTVEADVLKLMNGALAEMVFSDPPYNVDYEGGTGLKIQNDNMEANEFYRFLLAAFTNMFKVTAPGGAVYICHADSEGNNFRGALKESGWLMKQCLIWVKNQFIMGRQDYQWRHEPILYGWKPGAAHRWYGGRKQSTVIEDSSPIIIQQTGEGTVITITAGIEEIVLKVPSFEVLSTEAESTIWRFDKPLKNDVHPTMKPIGIPARAIRNSSKPGQILVDLFGGSGSTLIAAEQTGRICYTMELDPIYCDVIIQRWEEFTGKKAVKITA